MIPFILNNKSYANCLVFLLKSEISKNSFLAVSPGFKNRSFDQSLIIKQAFIKHCPTDIRSYRVCVSFIVLFKTFVQDVFFIVICRRNISICKAFIPLLIYSIYPLVIKMYQKKKTKEYDCHFSKNNLTE